MDEKSCLRAYPWLNLKSSIKKKFIIFSILCHVMHGHCEIRACNAFCFICSNRRLEMNSGDHASEVFVKVPEHTAAVITVIFQSLIASNHAGPNAYRSRLQRRRGKRKLLQPNNLSWNCCSSNPSFQPYKIFSDCLLLCMHTRARTLSAQFPNSGLLCSLFKSPINRRKEDVG